MKTGLQIFILLMVSLLVSALFAGVASAATDPTNVTLTGGSWSMTSMTVGDFAGVVLSGAAIEDHATASGFRVTDARGTGAGWNITVQATQFREWVNADYVTDGKTLAAGSLSMPEPTVLANGTDSPVPGIVSGPYIIDAGSAAKISSAALNAGMGKYDYTQEAGLTLSIPANAHAATYRSEVTISVVAGP